MSEFIETAREDPEAAREFAERIGGKLGKRMLELLDEEFEELQIDFETNEDGGIKWE